MTTKELGSIKKAKLRDVWPNEATDFTPWLEKNLSILSDQIGMELEVREREAPVGGFSLDLLARDTARQRPVVIENQLTSTNHDHLGKLLTYAAGHDAGVIIWIAEDLREEHRQALDWLNQRTDSNTEFYGVVVELLTVDGSRPAPHFKLVAFPNEWSPVKIESRDVSPRAEAYRGFFQRLIDRLREEYAFTGARKGQPNSFYFFSSGFNGIKYGASFVQGNRARVELYLDRQKEFNESLFDELAAERESIQAEFGQDLSWDRLDDGQASRIALNRDGSIVNDPETLEAIQEWMIDRLLKFKAVFTPKLDELVNS